MSPRKLLDRLLPVGSRSVLWGAHCFFIHPWFVAAGWWKLYGFPRDPRLWLVFFLHDLGYLFYWCPNMDGAEGERHPEWAARLVHALFDTVRREYDLVHVSDVGKRASLVAAGFKPEGEAPFRDMEGRPAVWYVRETGETYWRDLCLYHSRFYSKRDGVQPSKLCAADKLAAALEPWWLYLPRVILSGEIKEYMEASRAAALGRSGLGGSKYTGEPACTTAEEVAGLGPRRAWFVVMSNYCRKWALTHADGRADTWTPDAVKRETVR